MHWELVFFCMGRWEVGADFEGDEGGRKGALLVAYDQEWMKKKEGFDFYNFLKFGAI